MHLLASHDPKVEWKLPLCMVLEDIEVAVGYGWVEELESKDALLVFQRWSTDETEARALQSRVVESMFMRLLSGRPVADDALVEYRAQLVFLLQPTSAGAGSSSART